MAPIRPNTNFDLISGLVVSGYRFRGPGFDSQSYKISLEAVSLERVPLSLVRITEALLGRKKLAAPFEKTEINGVRNCCADQAKPLYPQNSTLT
jgi:hypothetical protein